MSRRYFLTLSDWFADGLELWADMEKTKPASLAAHLIEIMIRKEVESGRLPIQRAMPKSYKELKYAILENFDLLAAHPALEGRMEALIKGEAPTETEKLRIALLLGLTEPEIEELLNPQK